MKNRTENQIPLIKTSRKFRHNGIPRAYENVLSESLMHLLLRLIFCRRCLRFINVRAAYASKIQALPTKNPLANSGTTRFREHMKLERRTREKRVNVQKWLTKRALRMLWSGLGRNEQASGIVL